MSDKAITTQVQPARARRRKKWKPDPRGYYARQLGWVRTSTGKVQQHKFYLGKDLNEAKDREDRLRALWNRFAKSATTPKPLWPAPLLEVAKRLAAGENPIVVEREPDEEGFDYSMRLDRIRQIYPVVSFVAETPELDAYCDQVCAKWDSLPKQDIEIVLPTLEQMRAHREAERILEEANVSTAFISPHRSPTKTQTSDEPRLGRVSLREFSAITAGDPKKTISTWTGPRSFKITHIDAGEDSGPKEAVEPARSPPAASAVTHLHDALRAYQAYIQREYQDPETGQLIAWGNTQKRQVDTLIKHLPDQSLSSLDEDAIDELFGYWRRRPMTARGGKPMKSSSVTNYLARLKAALKWMDRSGQVGWSAPRSIGDFDTRKRRISSDDKPACLEQVKTFTLEELKLLMRYGQPLDRLMLLLGLNCGFGRAEIASLLVGEIKLFKGHTPEQIEILQYPTTDADSFIKRIRRKSRVYGEHILYPITVEGIQWAIEQGRQLPGFAPEARLLLNKKGVPYDRPTRGGNDNRTIPNRFGRLIERIQGDGQSIRKLSFGKLRKTAAQLIDSHSNGEIAGVFQCHGQPVKTDQLLDRYRNRPFGRVFEAIRRVEEYLAPVFEEAGATPFAAQPQSYLKRSVIKEIEKRCAAGELIGEIAGELGVSEMTVRRYRKKKSARSAMDNG